MRLAHLRQLFSTRESLSKAIECSMNNIEADEGQAVSKRPLVTYFVGQNSAGIRRVGRIPGAPYVMEKRRIGHTAAMWVAPCLRLLHDEKSNRDRRGRHNLCSGVSIAQDESAADKACSGRIDHQVTRAVACIPSQSIPTRNRIARVANNSSLPCSCPCYFKSARLGCGYLDDPRKQDEGPRVRRFARRL